MMTSIPMALQVSQMGATRSRGMGSKYNTRSGKSLDLIG